MTTNLFIDGESGIVDASGRHTFTNSGVSLSETTVHNGSKSIYFSNGSMLSAAASEDFNFISDDFTIDFWIYLDGAQTLYPHVLCYTDDSTGWYIVVWPSNNQIIFQNVHVLAVTTSYTIPINTYFHLAFTKQSGQFYVFANGTKIKQVAMADLLSYSGDLRIGSWDGSANTSLTGYMDNVRIVKGEALWTSDFNVNDENALLYPTFTQPTYTNIRSLYNISSVKGNLRGKAALGYIRPTIKQLFTSEDWSAIQRYVYEPVSINNDFRGSSPSYTINTLNAVYNGVDETTIYSSTQNEWVISDPRKHIADEKCSFRFITTSTPAYQHVGVAEISKAYQPGDKVEYVNVWAYNFPNANQSYYFYWDKPNGTLMVYAQSGGFKTQFADIQVSSQDNELCLYWRSSLTGGAAREGIFDFSGWTQLGSTPPEGYRNDIRFVS